MRILVTGGNRYIGLDLVRELTAAGHEVTVINSHEAPLPDGVRRIHADRRQPGALTAALRGERDAFDVVFDHTAVVRRAAHDRDVGPSGRPRHSGSAGASVRSASPT